MSIVTEKAIKDKIRFIQDTLYVIGGKWKLPILIAIYHGNTRFSDLKKCLPDITSRTLSKELKELEANHLVIKTAHSSAMVKYEFAPYGKSLSPVIRAMMEWGEQHRAKILGK